MTTDREQIIAAAREAGADFQCETMMVNKQDADDFITSFYALAFEAGRQAEREGVANLAENLSYMNGKAFAQLIRARGESK